MMTVARSGRRPLGVVVLVVLVLLIGAQSLLAAFGIVPARSGSLGSLLSDATQLRVVSIAVGVVSIGAAIEMWRLRRAGWYSTMLLAGAGLLVQISLYFWGTANYFTLALCVAAAIYLNQREVKVRFLGARTEATVVMLEREEDDGG